MSLFTSIADGSYRIRESQSASGGMSSNVFLEFGRKHTAQVSGDAESGTELTSFTDLGRFLYDFAFLTVRVDNVQRPIPRVSIRVTLLCSCSS